MTYMKARHFLQSEQWAKFQKNLGHHTFQKSGQGWEYFAILERGYGKLGRHFRRLYVPYGPTATNNEALQHALASLDKLARDSKVDYIRIEPVVIGIDNKTLKPAGYTITKRTTQPQHTLLVDLTCPMQDILQGMSKTNRYLWNKVARNNIRFKTSYKEKDLQHFLDMMSETAARTQSKFHDDYYFKALMDVLGPTKNAGVAYAYHNDDVLVGVLFADDFVAKTRYYLYAGSFDRAREFSANSPLVVYLLEQAKELGMETFDFFGVSPKEATNHRWAGLSKFKRSFGGEEIVFSGTWEKPIRKGRYVLMDLARKFA